MHFCFHSSLIAAKMSFHLTSREEKDRVRWWRIDHNNMREGYEMESPKTGLPDSLPLVVAATKGNIPKVKALLTAGADVNAEDDSGTPLTAAVENGHHECVEFLLNSRACVNQKDLFGETPIFYAAYSDDSRCADLLIKAGADVNVRGMNRTTPLLQAAYNRSVNCTKSLLKAGAPVNIRNCDRLNALESSLTCFKDINPDIVALLYAAGERLKTKSPDRNQLLTILGADDEFKLKRICRKVITTCLIKKNRHENLFMQVPRLNLPSPLRCYLLHDINLEDPASN